MKLFIKKNLKPLLALFFNIAIIIMELVGLIRCISEVGFKNIFIFYTEDSNIFLLITSIIITIYLLIYLIKDIKLPKVLKIIRFSSVCTVLETFLVVVTVLGFTTQTDSYGHSGHYQMLFMGSMLFHHFLCPVISAISFLLLEGIDNDKFTIKDSLFAFIPTVVYGSIIITLNILKVIVGPYPFLHVYEQTVLMSIIWSVAILGLAFTITIVVGYLYKLINKKK